MKVFKFGGASVKDAAAVKNVASIIQKFPNDKLVIVISAMGKVTNALEDLHRAQRGVLHGTDQSKENPDGL